MKTIRQISLGLLTLLLLLASCKRGPQPANPATEFSFRTASGATETTAQYLGKPLVVNFWADW